MLRSSQTLVLDDKLQSVENGGYLMINRLELRKFRCFEHLDLSLKRFNILVGESGSGKTAFMESVFMLGGSSPEIYFRIRNWRGFSRNITFTGTREQYQSLFRDLFYKFNQDEGIVIRSQDDRYGSRKLEIAYGELEDYGLDLEGPSPHAFKISPINFKWIIDGTVHNTSASVKEGKFSFSGAAPVAPVSYYNSVNVGVFESVSAFSALSKHYRADALVGAIAAIYPQVKGITLELVSGDAVLCADVGLNEKIPLGELSGGISKFAAYTLAILANPGGVVLIDEIEDGVYYKNMPDVWRSLVTLCLREEVQLIVSTHSYEFLQAAAPILAREEIAKESQLLRAEIDENGNNVIRKIPAQALDAATSRDFEVR